MVRKRCCSYVFALLMAAVVIPSAASAIEPKWQVQKRAPKAAQTLTKLGKKYLCVQNRNRRFLVQRVKRSGGKSPGQPEYLRLVNGSKLRKSKDKAVKKLAKLQAKCAAYEPCAVDAVDLAVYVIGGQTRTITPNPANSCSAPLTLAIVRPPTKGALLSAGGGFEYTAPAGSFGEDRFRYKACSGPICDEADARVISCDITGISPSAVTAHEHSTTDFSLTAQSSCHAAASFTLLNPPAGGSAAVAPDGHGSFSAGWGAPGQEQLVLRVCDANGAGCRGGFTLTLNLQRLPDFSGTAESLEPYREVLSPAERRYLERKFLLNRLLPPADGQLTLTQLIDSRILNEEWFAEDVEQTLLDARDAPEMRFPRPHSDKFITLPPNPPPPGQTLPIFQPDQTFSSSAEQRWGVEQMLAVFRHWHPTLYKYYWSAWMINSHLLVEARYLSPSTALMTHLLLGHFGVGSPYINGNQEHRAGDYYMAVKRRALGSFKQLMLGDHPQGCAGAHFTESGLICDSLVLQFLDNQNNTATSPNQNYAREIMELHTLGPFNHIAGVPNFDHIADVEASTGFLSGYEQTGVSTASYNPARHDTAARSMFTHLSGIYPEAPIVNRSLTPEEMVRHILDRHPGAPQFIAGKIFGMLVHDPSDVLREELGARLKAMDYDLKEFLRMILRSEALFSAASAGRRCVIEPFKRYAMFINGLELPLLPMRGGRDLGHDFLIAGPHYQLRGLNAVIEEAGETVLGYPTVFSYEYCGRDPGKDGAKEWLISNRLIANVTGPMHFLRRHREALDFSMAEIGAKIAQFAGDEDFSASDAVRYFEMIFDVRLRPEQRAIITDYLLTTPDGQELPWDPKGAPLEAKLAGLVPIFNALPQAIIR